MTLLTDTHSVSQKKTRGGTPSRNHVCLTTGVREWREAHAGLQIEKFLAAGEEERRGRGRQSWREGGLRG